MHHAARPPRRHRSVRGRRRCRAAPDRTVAVAPRGTTSPSQSRHALAATVAAEVGPFTARDRGHAGDRPSSHELVGDLFAPGRPHRRRRCAIAQHPHSPRFRVRRRVHRRVHAASPRCCAARAAACVRTSPTSTIACLRSRGLPARYVSGYIETMPPPGEPKLDRHRRLARVGAASGCPNSVGSTSTRRTTRCRRSATSRSAWGRDYFDVTPVRGVVIGPAATQSLDRRRRRDGSTSTERSTGRPTAASRTRPTHPSDFRQCIGVVSGTLVARAGRPVLLGGAEPRQPLRRMVRHRRAHHRHLLPAVVPGHHAEAPERRRSSRPPPRRSSAGSGPASGAVPMPHPVRRSGTCAPTSWPGRCGSSPTGVIDRDGVSGLARRLGYSERHLQPAAHRRARCRSARARPGPAGADGPHPHRDHDDVDDRHRVRRRLRRASASSTTPSARCSPRHPRSFATIGCVAIDGICDCVDRPAIGVVSAGAPSPGAITLAAGGAWPVRRRRRLLVPRAAGGARRRDVGRCDVSTHAPSGRRPGDGRAAAGRRDLGRRRVVQLVARRPSPISNRRCSAVVGCSTSTPTRSPSTAISATDPVLAPLVAARPGLRSPGAVDGTELLVRAILGQQVSVAGARTVAGRLAAAVGERVPLGRRRRRRIGRRCCSPRPARSPTSIPSRCRCRWPGGAALLGACGALADRRPRDRSRCRPRRPARATRARCPASARGRRSTSRCGPSATPMCSCPPISVCVTRSNGSASTDRPPQRLRSLPVEPVALVRPAPSLAVVSACRHRLRRPRPEGPADEQHRHRHDHALAGRRADDRSDRARSALRAVGGRDPHARHRWPATGGDAPTVVAAILDAASSPARGVLRRRAAPTFDLPLDPVGTPFQQSAWQVLRTIPYGSTMTYGEQARSLGDPNKARAVGAANGRNPISIIVPVPPSGGLRTARSPASPAASSRRPGCSTTNAASSRPRDRLVSTSMAAGVLGGSTAGRDRQP